MGGGLDEHDTSGGSELAKERVKRGGRGAATRGLAAVDGVEVGHLDGDGLPGCFEILGEEHRERGFYTLAGIGARGDEADGAVEAEADEGVGREVAGGRSFGDLGGLKIT